MKELNMDDLNLYLVSESAITDNDVIRLREAPQLPKNQVAFNLYCIIKSRHTLPQFLNALKRSSEENPWHGELYEMISKERERRMASQHMIRSKSLSLNKVKHSTLSFFSLPGEVECHSIEYSIQEDEGLQQSKPNDENERDLQLSSSSITMSALPCVESTPSCSHDQMTERNESTPSRSHDQMTERNESTPSRSHDQMAERNEQVQNVIVNTNTTETEHLKSKLYSSGLPVPITLRPPILLRMP